MNDPVFAAAAGALAAGGLWLIVAGWTGTVFIRTAPGPSRARRVLSDRRTAGQLLASVVVALLMLVITGWPVAALASGAAVMILPRVLSGRAAQRRIEKLEAIETWTRQIADSLSAKAGIEEALLTSAENPPPALAGEIAALRRRLRFHVSTAEALRALADDLNDPVGDMVVAALLIAASADAGPGLRGVLTELARTTAKTVAAEREIDAERAAHRTTARWVVVALAAFTGFAMLNRGYVEPFSTAGGQLVLAFIAALYAGAIYWLHRLASPEQGHRFLPPAASSRKAGRS